MKVIKEGRIPIKIWATDLEEGALEQARNLSNLPFAFKHIALAPDCHQGFGMPIGGILATKGYVISNAVGKDIGCGMHSVKTNITVADFKTDTLKEIMGEIRKKIPVGFKHHKENYEEYMPACSINLLKDMIVSQQWKSACSQIGTLGGGNHFIEIQKGSDGFIWFMIHSGSRNLGKQVADYYDKISVELNKKWGSSVPPSHELAYLPLDSPEAKSYLAEMDYCLEFAKANRTLMASWIKKIFTDHIVCKFDEEIDIHHNYAVMEHHFGENVMVHRKGATSAKEGEIGIIPGSQGTSSYIVKGLGNPESFKSCSHGAGRKMGRQDAKKTLNLQEEQKELEDKGILHTIRGKDNLDEAPGSYKDIDVVMKNQEDLVKIVVKLEPLGCIKG